MGALASIANNDAAAAPAAASASALQDALPAVKRFKKSVVAEAAAGGAASAPAALAAAPAAAPAATADSVGWDFEKDLENIFATGTLPPADGGDKARSKGKAKGAQ